MNRLLRKLEQKYGKWAIPNLTTVMIVCYVIGYVLLTVNAGIISYMTLEPGLILRGQVWRLITWIVIPPSGGTFAGFGSLFIVIMLFFYYSIGRSLERAWGMFRYNVYILGGMLVTVIAAFICYFVFSAIYGGSVSVGMYFSTYYVTTSMFLAFAATFPDAVVLLMFIIPVKVKYLGILYFAMIVYECIGYVQQIMTEGVYYLVPVIAIAASLVNFAVFFFSTRDFSRYSYKERQRKREFNQQMEAGRRRFAENAKRARSYDSYDTGIDKSDARKAAEGQSAKRTFARHRCEICGRTEITDPDLEFRYCSKCEGSHEYCMEHLYTHKHVIVSKNGPGTL
ncbi:MAG: hypothetical protein VZR05_00620 [Lachnospiraceae bacterium]|nr:hypothetical protein [Lachnospiraceae bacterium]MEE3436627.1 hypothetical protein [Lachnospiraceae bacterium]